MFRVFLAMAVIGLPLADARAQENGRNLAAACAMCHGTEGKPAPGAPIAPLAGMGREQIAAQMRAFRDASRPATVMHQIAKGYTDVEIDALAGWFSGRKR